MLKTSFQAGKAVWSDLIFIVVLHLFLLSLYAFVYGISAVAKSQYYFSSKSAILGAYI